VLFIALVTEDVLRMSLLVGRSDSGGKDDPTLGYQHTGAEAHEQIRADDRRLVAEGDEKTVAYIRALRVCPSAPGS
jgi:hypothetical protein